MIPARGGSKRVPGKNVRHRTVLARVVDAIPDLVSDTLAGLAGGWLVPRPQPAGVGTYFGGRVEGDEWLDWSGTSLSLYNKIRGITRPGPGARTLHCDRPIVVWRAEYDPDWPRYRATPGGMVGRAPGGGVVVKTGDSTLVLREVQAEGSAPEAPGWRVGTRLGVNLSAVVPALTARVAELERQLVRRRQG